MSLKGTRLRIVAGSRRKQSYSESSEGVTFQRESWSLLFFHRKIIRWPFMEHLGRIRRVKLYYTLASAVTNVGLSPAELVI